MALRRQLLPMPDTKRIDRRLDAAADANMVEAAQYREGAR